jgi:hypothetical protein
MNPSRFSDTMKTERLVDKIQFKPKDTIRIMTTNILDTKRALEDEQIWDILDSSGIPATLPDPQNLQNSQIPHPSVK